MGHGLTCLEGNVDQGNGKVKGLSLFQKTGFRHNTNAELPAPKRKQGPGRPADACAGTIEWLYPPGQTCRPVRADSNSASRVAILATASATGHRGSAPVLTARAKSSTSMR